MSDTKAWGSPSRYIQGPGEIRRLPMHTAKYGKKAGAVIDSFFYEEYTEMLKKLYEEDGGAFLSARYETEITHESINKVWKDMETLNPDVMIGIGGGKTIDTAKCVASRMNIPLVVIPTSASTDAPTSAMAIIYNDAHEHSDVEYFVKNPDLVLVDSEIIANAPVRFLVSGMGDALATVFEGRATIRTNSNNYICGESGTYRYTRTAAAIAEVCYETIMKYGRMAKLANEQHVVNEALEAVIEANTLMSGIGFENVGCAASHCVHNGLTCVKNGEKSLHGEKVAFGVICQLVAENAPAAMLEEVINFNLDVGLPVTLEDMGIEATEENFTLIAGNPAETEWTREGIRIDAEAVKGYVKCADALGHLYKQKHNKNYL